MFRKTIAFLTSLLLALCLILPVTAQEYSYIADEAGLLYQEEVSSLEEKAEELSSLYSIDAVILTVDSLGGSRAQDCADDYYDHTGYGADGVLFLLAMGEREWYISTCGKMIYALTDYGTQQIGEEILPYLAEGRWYEGFSYFLDALPVYLDAYESGAPIDGQADYSGDYYHGDQEEIVYYEEEFTPYFPFSLLCGIVIAGIVVLIMRLSMNTKRSQHSASVYMTDGSWNLTQRQDIFLYSNVTKTRKQEPPKNSGGGSSVHRASSGRRHGGGGGKF